MTHEELMLRAIELSEEGLRRRAGGPFGSLVALQGEVVGEGWNRVTSSNDPTAHAEMVAIRDATARLERFELRGCVLYTSCEPCPMCLSASYWARVDHIYYANTRYAAAEIGFDDRFLYEQIPLPIDQRSLPLTRIEHVDAPRAFDRWQADPDKIPF